jgi:hypothetical protein
VVLQVQYGGLRVSLGNELTPTQVKAIPAVHWSADDGSYYLLCMTGVLIGILRTIHCVIEGLCDCMMSAECWSLGLRSQQAVKRVS